jgi:molecular chaperone HscC
VDLVARRRGLAEALAGNATARARLRLACEHAKRRLSTEESAAVVVPGLELGRRARVDLEEPITRADAEAAWQELLGRLRTPILRALRDANAEPAAIDEVLLVGGATRMPCVHALAAQIFGRLPLRTLPPDEAVAMGAAVQAALKAQDAAVDDMVVTDVAPFSMGIAVANDFGRAQVTGLYAPIIERGTVIPTSRVESFRTMSDGQRQIEVEVFQGEHSLCADNRKLGQFTVGDLPPRPRGEVAIAVRFTYDLNGLLEVEATVETGRSVSAVFEHTPGRLGRTEIEEARKAMARLKFHPRDALPNVTALSRGEALFVELTGPAREALGHAMATFRAALERQDPAEIERAREALVALTAVVSR